MSRATNQIAETLAREGANELAAEQGDRQVLKKMNAQAWHILERQIADPKVKNKELAAELGVTQATVSRIVNSPCFDYEMRRLRNNALIGKLLEAAEVGVGSLTEIMQDEDADAKDKIDATKTVFTALGMGANQGNSGVNINVNQNNAGDAAAAGVTREMVERAANRRKERVINAQAEATEGETNE